LVWVFLPNTKRKRDLILTGMKGREKYGPEQFEGKATRVCWASVYHGSEAWRKYGKSVKCPLSLSLGPVPQ
jgi:hypothetical protein